MQPEGGPASKIIGCVIGIGLLVVLGAVGFAIANDGGMRIVFGVIAAVIALIIGVTVVRSQIARGTYEVILPELTGAPRLGSALRWRPAVQCKKAFTTGTPTAQLICREHAVNRGGTSDTHYNNDLVKQEFVLGEARRLSPGEVAEFAVDARLPANGIPSFSGQNNFIEWELVVRVPARGLIPDIRQAQSLQIPPELEKNADRGMGPESVIPVEWLAQVKAPRVRDKQGPVCGRMTARDAATSNGLYVVAAGETLKLELNVETSSNIHCRNVLCWAGCKIHGSGSEEKVTVLEWHPILEGDFNAGMVINRTLDVRVPAGGPVSFQGRYVKMDWMVRVRVDIPIWRDKVLELPFIVTPRLV